MHPKLKETLERFYREYDLKSRIEHDPIEFPHRYDKPEEIEIAGMIASSLAYGNVTLFKPVINKILSVPVDSLREFMKGVKLFFPSPEDGSACKRLNLYLRWMVRSDDGVDFGILDKIPPSKLIIPLDTHIARICIYLGLTRLKSAGWKMAEEITDNLKLLDPDDPVKYDFALCHLGISGECPLLSVRSSEFGIRGGGRLSRLSEKCCDCSLRNVCNWAVKKS